MDDDVTSLDQFVIHPFIRKVQTEMLESPHFVAAAAAAACLLFLIVVCILGCFCHRRKKASSGKNLNRDESLPEGIHHVCRRELSSRLLFNWGDHPSLVFDGWSRFAFSGQNSSPSASNRAAAILGDPGTEVEFSWEGPDGIADLMQKIRLNPGLKKTKSSHLSVLMAALPLPGPSSSFPQEAYFEITILSPVEEDKQEGEKTKLNGKGQRNKTLRELMMGDGYFSVGLSRGGVSSAKKSPGSYHGSIGFNSNGSIYLNGMKLTSRNEYGLEEDRVIGCGYNPTKKEVFFTSDSELVQVIHCKSEEFGSPLYPIIASDTKVTILVNLGQTVFKYAPANRHRIQNTYSEYNKEMFSIRKPSGLEFDTDSESDLFEIVLDKHSRFPPILSNNF